MTELGASLLEGYEEPGPSQDQLRIFKMEDRLLVSPHCSSEEVWQFLAMQIPLGRERSI